MEQPRNIITKDKNVSESFVLKNIIEKSLLIGLLFSMPFFSELFTLKIGSVIAFIAFFVTMPSLTYILWYIFRTTKTTSRLFIDLVTIASFIATVIFTLALIFNLNPTRGAEAGAGKGILFILYIIVSLPIGFIFGSFFASQIKKLENPN